jgi:uncharacterized protein (DUF1697 family)
MTPQITLLRAVNVGGVKVSMADLKTLLIDLGFEGVRTLLNSGNAVFRSKGTNGVDLEEALETEFAKRAGRRSFLYEPPKNGNRSSTGTR